MGGLSRCEAAPAPSRTFPACTPFLVGALLLGVGLTAYLVYCAMDRRLGASEPEAHGNGSDDGASRKAEDAGQSPTQ